MNTFKITITGPRDIGGAPSIEVVVPTLPHVGDHISHDPSGISGYVKSVSFWWPEDGSDLHIEINVR